MVFYGSFNVRYQNDGLIFGENFDFRKWIDIILERRGKLCTLFFDAERSELLFAFNETFDDVENYTQIQSFKIGNDVEEIKKQFYIPKDYLKYYPDKIVRIIGLDDAFCLSNIDSENYEVNSAEIESLLAELENKNDGDRYFTSDK